MLMSRTREAMTLRGERDFAGATGSRVEMSGDAGFSRGRVVTGVLLRRAGQWSRARQRDKGRQALPCPPAPQGCHRARAVRAIGFVVECRCVTTGTGNSHRSCSRESSVSCKRQVARDCPQGSCQSPQCHPEGTPDPRAERGGEGADQGRPGGLAGKLRQAASAPSRKQVAVTALGVPAAQGGAEAGGGGLGAGNPQELWLVRRPCLLLLLPPGLAKRDQREIIERSCLDMFPPIFKLLLFSPRTVSMFDFSIRGQKRPPATSPSLSEGVSGAQGPCRLCPHLPRPLSTATGRGGFGRWGSGAEVTQPVSLAPEAAGLGSRPRSREASWAFSHDTMLPPRGESDFPERKLTQERQRLAVSLPGPTVRPGAGGDT